MTSSYPLHDAVIAGNLALVSRKLIDHPGCLDVQVAPEADDDGGGGPPAHHPRPYDIGATPLMMAARGGHDAIVRVLVMHGANIYKIDQDNWDALTYASMMGNLSIVSFLIEKGADPTWVTAAGWTPLVLSACNGHTDVVKYLLSILNIMGIDFNPHGHTALYLACEQGYRDTAALLLEAGAKKGGLTLDRYGATAYA